MPKDRPPRQPGERSELDCRRDVETRAKRGERDASRATPEDVQPDTDRALARDVAGWTGLEPAASGVTGRRSNQLNYHP